MTIFYMHVPKTAGSSVSKMFIDYFGADQAIEQCQNPRYRDVDLNSYSFVSGHVAWQQAKNRLSSDTYRFTVLRDPVDQLISHLNWVKRLNKPEFKAQFDANRRDVQLVAKSLEDLDISNPLEVSAYLTRAEGKVRELFINNQAMYFLPVHARGPNLGLKEANLAVESLKSFHAIATLESVDSLIRKVSEDNSLDIQNELPSRNVSVSKEEMKEKGDARELLIRHLQLDELLYQIVRSM